MPKLHENAVKKLCEEWQSSRIPEKENSTSNTMRKKNYRSVSQTARKLNRVLSVDVGSRIVWAEPGVTMEELVAATLHYGLIPKVVPEFKGITVGGAINGAALESSSHLFGQFNDTCTGYELMIGDGSIIWVDDKEHSDIFYAIAGSYGTLGTILSAKIELIPAKKYVKLQYHHCRLEELFPYLQEQNESESKPDFLEAIVYNKHHAVAIIGWLTDDKEKLPLLSLEQHWAPWFYGHVKDQLNEECITLSDYLFRHDRGAFWMGGFAPDPQMSLSYLSHKASLYFGKQWDFSETLIPSQCIPRVPGIFFRSLFGWLMDSQKLYASLHGGSEEWFEKKFAIQDFYFQGKQALEFTLYALEKYRIQPIWICPILSTSKPQIFSPHFRESKELLFDVGIYGLPANTPGPLAVRDLENLTGHLNGRKMFYCHAYFTEEEFWKIYPKDTYKHLRDRYHLDSYPEITTKVLK